MVDLFLLRMLAKKRNTVMAVIAAGVSAALYEWIDVKILATVGMIYITLFVSDLSMKFIFNHLPRKLLDNFDDKAVLITGKS